MPSIKCCVAIASFSLLCSCSVLTSDTQPASAYLGDWGVDLNNLDTTTAPGTDFYRYVNGKWLDQATIPAGYPVMNAFVEVNTRTEQQLQAIVDSLGPQAPVGSPDQQVYALHQSLIDQATRNALGLKPIQPLLASIQQAASRAELVALMAKPGYPTVMETGVLQDFGNPERMVGLLGQGGLTLPGRDYYLQEKLGPLRDAYAAYIAATLQRAEPTLTATDATQQASHIVAFETRIAREHWAPVRTRDRIAAYHLMTAQELKAYAPGYDWDAFLPANPLGKSPQIIVTSDTAIQGLARLYGDTGLATLKQYMTFRLLNDYAPFLSEEWENAHFEFFGKMIQGIEKQRPLAERALVNTNALLGEPLGQLYVKRYFPEADKKQVETMVGYLLEAYRERLTGLDWMDDATRQEALAKLSGITVKIGYPDVWHDYSALILTPDNLVANIQAVLAWKRADEFARLQEPPRKWEWAMVPQTINAYYTSSGNEIVFPAGILQPPFFDPAADVAVNFGAIGMVIGHEIGHGFDDQGSRSDAEGRLRNWWTDNSRHRFEAKTGHLVTQYSGYAALPDLHVNGQLTLGENIGDLGGTQVALIALQKYIADHPAQVPQSLDGYTPIQRYFLSFAQLWHGKYSTAFLRRQVLTDPHSPNEFRVNGVVPNLNEWYEAFGIKADDTMFKPAASRIHIW